MPVPERARLVRIELDGELSGAEGCLLVRGDERPFALAGDWAGGGALSGSEPLRGGARRRGSVRAARRSCRWSATRRTRRRAPWAAAGSATSATTSARGSSALAAAAAAARRAARRSRSPSTTTCCASTRDGRWWFEALWTPSARGRSRARLDAAARRAREPACARGPSGRARSRRRRRAAPGTARGGRRVPRAHRRRRDLPGEPVPAPRGRVEGRPARPVRAQRGDARARHAAFVAGPWGAMCSLSPELFLRRRGREVLSDPIKGTPPRPATRAHARRRPRRARRLRQGPRRERDDRRPDAQRPRARVRVRLGPGAARSPSRGRAPGVWHLVSDGHGHAARRTSATPTCCAPASRRAR